MGEKRAFQAQEIGQAKCRGRKIAQGWDPGADVKEQERESFGNVGWGAEGWPKPGLWGAICK